MKPPCSNRSSPAIPVEMRSTAIFFWSRLAGPCGGLDDDALSFDDVEFELCWFDIGATHLLNDQAARQPSLLPDHFQNDGAGDQIFFDAVHGPLAGARHRIGSQ